MGTGPSGKYPVDERYPNKTSFRMDDATRDMLEQLRAVLHRPKRDILTGAIVEVWQRVIGGKAS